MQSSRSLIALIWLMLASLACTISLGGAPIPPDSAAPSPEALDSFNEKWLDLPEMLTNSHFTLTFSEEEVAAVIEVAIADASTEMGSEIPLQNPHIDLETDIILYAQTDGGLFRASGLMTLHPSVSPDGQLDIQVQSAEFGRISFDEAALEQIGSSVAAALTRPADGLPVAVVLTGASVTDRQLVLTGSIVE